MTAWALERILHRDRSFARWIGEWGTPPVLGEILGCDTTEAISTATTSPASRHPIMAWSYVVAAQEAEFPRDAHRQNNTDRAGVPAAPGRPGLRAVRRRTTHRRQRHGQRPSNPPAQLIWNSRRR